MLKTAEAVHGIVNRAQHTLFGYQGWGSVCRDENGTLYAVSSAFRVNHICPFGKTALYVSRDGGRSWTPPIVLNDSYLDDRDAGIVYLGGGRLLVSWFTHSADFYLHTRYTDTIRRTGPTETGPVAGMLAMYPMLPASESHGGSYVRISEDYGVTWSEKVQLPVSAPHGPTLCRDGTLLYLGKELYAGTMENPGIPKGVIAAFASADSGKSWQLRGICEKPASLSWENFYEPHVIELDDGRLLGMIRAQGEEVAHGFTMVSTFSDDGGRTWSEYRPTGVCGAPPHLLQHSSGALICAFGRRQEPTGERALVSYDRGETWEDEYILNENTVDRDLGYPCSVELDDGRILTVYYQKYRDDSAGVRDAKCSLLYTVWKL